jgi:hypothetical protein
MAQGSSFESLLEQSRDLVCERLGAALSRMLDNARDALSVLSRETQGREPQELYQETGRKILAQRETLEREFRRFYLRDFDRRSNSVKNGGQSFSELEMSSLQLVGEAVLEETIKFRDMAAKVRRYCDEELAALDQRVGVLLGDANLEDDTNPLSPLAICEAYQQACHEFDSSLHVRRVLLRLFDDHVLDDVRSIYKAVNALLVQNSILPKIRYGVSKNEGGKPPAGGQRTEGKEPETPASADALSEQGIFAMLQKLVGGMPGAASAPAGQVVLQGPELLGTLTRIQQGDTSGIAGAPAELANGAANVLHQLKASSLGAGMVQVDAMTLDIVAMLFDQLFDDPKIPIGLKGLIGRLQIPVLKVAIADKSLFSNKSHPARQLLDTLGEVALRLPADFNAPHPLFSRLEAGIQEIVSGFQDDMAIFDRVSETLQALVAEEDQKVEHQASAIAARMEQAENLALAKTAAQEEVRVRVRAPHLPGPVLEFLVEHWLKLLLLLHVKCGKEGDEWKDAVQAMDQLVWSVEPKPSVQERRALAAVVPGLLKRLAGGLQTAGVDEQVRVRFFADLMTYHTRALGLETKAKNAGAPQPAAAPAKRASESLDFTAPVTVKNPYGAGEVQVTGAGAKDAEVPTNFTMGTWVEIREKGSEAGCRVAKLLFVSPKKTRYLFSDRRGQNIVQLTRAELAHRMRSGEVVRLDSEPEEPLFDRIMNSMVGKLRAPSPAH